MRVKAGKVIIFLSLVGFVLAMIFSQCTSDTTVSADPRGSAYADQQTCIKCHKDVWQSYSHTGHYHTSAPVHGTNLGPEVKPDSNYLTFDANTKISIEKRNDGVYQATYINNQKTREGRFDIAFGSGEKAKTFGYWKDNTLFELPVSYFKTIRNWANSPAFPLNRVNYDHEIIRRCFECHGSYAVTTKVQNGALSVSEEYDKNSIVYGIDCQRCHGPAAEHVAYQTRHPEDRTPHAITPYKALTRQQRIDMCAICHSGNDLATVRSTFAFVPKDTAANFYEPDFGASSSTQTDVHGKQYQLLNASKCFASSLTMTCTTCHDSHQKETGNVAAYAQKCISCHQEGAHNSQCKLAKQLGSSLNTYCVDCHMPALPSQVITYRMSGKLQATPYLLRTHRIAVYTQKTQEVLSLIKKGFYKKTS